jgi:hypothetical protein
LHCYSLEGYAPAKFSAGRRNSVILLLSLGWSSSLLAQTPFYQGKTNNILVGTKTGDVYDLYPRLLAEFWTNKLLGGN